MPEEAATEGFLGRLGRKWAENRENAAQRAAERAKAAFQQTLGGVIQGYAAVARQWIELHFAATVNGRHKEQAEFDPLRKALSENVVRVAQMQGRVPVDAMAYSEIRSEQTAISEAQKAVGWYVRENSKDPWDAVEAEIITQRTKDLQQAFVSEKHKLDRLEEYQIKATAEEQRQAEIQAEWDAGEPRREALRQAARNAPQPPVPEIEQSKPKIAPIPAPKVEPPKPQAAPNLEPETTKPKTTPKPSGGMSGP